jgi:hypothetical protein
MFLSIPEVIRQPGCSWNWEDVNVATINRVDIGDLKNRNLRIVNYVMDLPAFKMIQHQVSTETSLFCCCP